MTTALRLSPALAATLLLMVTSATTAVVPIVRTIAIVFIVASVLAGFLFRREELRTHASVAMAIVAIGVTGLTRGGLPYQIGCALCVLVVLGTLRGPLVARRIQSASRAWRAMFAIGLVALCVIAALLTALPPASAIAERTVQKYAGDGAGQDQVGFTTRIRVGSMHKLLLSKRVLMRVEGQPVEYLRGVVLDRYEARVWSSSKSAATTFPVPADAPEERTTTHIEMSREALAARTPERRWFLPADACDVRTASGRMALDPLGGVHPDPPNDTRKISFGHTGGGACTRALAARSDPTQQDLTLNAKIGGQLLPAAEALTRGTKTDREALDAIVRGLSKYNYVNQDHLEGAADPIVSFLYVTRSGHCEHFASAMALLARTKGIPTRLVVGFRASERNPITGLGIVRDQDAHSWVDAWVDGHWESFDPTPLVEGSAHSQASWWDHLSEAASLSFDRAITWLSNITLATYGITATVTAVVLIIVRRITQGRAKKKSSADIFDVARPLPSFETLATALATAGWVRTASEPLERFARRVDASGEPWSTDVAEALDRYAELRYGGIGEEKLVVKRLDELSRRIATSSAPRASGP